MEVESFARVADPFPVCATKPVPPTWLPTPVESRSRDEIASTGPAAVIIAVSACRWAASAPILLAQAAGFGGAARENARTLSRSTVT
jgi:hypothetical protein